jgi:hypothetical protein
MKRSRMMRSIVASAGGAIALLLVMASSARADVSEAVQKKFKGQILVAADPLPDSAEDDATLVRLLNKANITAVTHRKSEGVAVWRFHFMAFMKKKPGVTQIALDFYTDDPGTKKKEFVAQERLTGIDPTLTLLSSEVEISEDDGLTPGRAYLVKLTAEVKGKDVVLATTKLRAK